MGYQAYPLQWPEGWARAKSRRNSAFKISSFAYARDLLLAEIRRMKGTDVVLSTNIRLRLDGLPYANDRDLVDPGIAVYFLRKGVRQSFGCDVFNTTKENAYAIAKTIEAMRGIERWGATEMMERAFAGFKALPASTEPDWWDVLQVSRQSSREEIETNFKRLLRDRHPDRGGSHDAMSELNKAREKALREVKS